MNIPNNAANSLAFPIGDPSTVQNAIGTVAGGVTAAAGGGLGAVVVPALLSLALVGGAVWGIWKLAERLNEY